MPKNKTPKNGFYWYMQEILPGLRREGRVFPNGMKDVVVVAIPLWKNLPVEERERFERMAKERKRQANKNPDADKTRLDNQGDVIAFREDSEAEHAKMRLRDRKIARSRWPDEDEILTYPFYFVAFEYLCETEEKEYLPCEVAVLEYSLQHGIMRTYHKFIKPGSIPLGYRYSCQSHSDDTHQIPIEGFEQADNNYLGIWTQIENFINQDQRKPEYPPLYCFCAGDGVNYRVTDYCMRWLHVNACTRRPNTLHKIYVLEDMVEDLYKTYKGDSISVTSIQNMLSTSAFDYEPNTRCSYHEEKEVKYCALGSIKRYAFALSDALSPIFDFELTGNHLPVQDSSTPAYAILPASAVHLDSGPKKSAQKSYSSLVDNFGSHSSKFRSHPEIEGTFASRDVRYVQDSGAEASDSESTHAGSVSSQSPWGPAPINNILPGPTSSGPWAKTAAMQRQAPSVTSEEEFPSLGGSSSQARPKYAGRASAPDPSVIPKPDPWQPPQHQSEPPQRLPNTMPMSALSSNPPPIVMATSAAEKAQAAAASKRTLSQAVAQTENKPSPPPPQPLAPSAGRGIRPMGAATRSINSGGFNPGAARVVNSSSFNPGAPTQAARKPTLGEAVQQNMQSQQPAWGSSVGAVAPPPNSMNGVGIPSDQNLPGLGRGRGRGVYSGGARQASGGSGMSVPPGFGRGEAARAKLNSQMSGLSLN